MIQIRPKPLFLLIDPVIVFCVLALSAVGLACIYSATSSNGIASLFFKKQLFGVVSGFCIYLLCAAIDHRTLISLGRLGYFCALVLLFITLAKGYFVMGARRWLAFGSLRMQPSELIKVFFPAYFCHFMARFEFSDSQKLTITHIAWPVCMLIFGVLLIAKQPDLATSLLVLFSGLLLLWVAPVSRSFFLLLAGMVIILSPALWLTLKPYQKKRIEVFLGVEQNKKDCYQIEQSVIAVGSGGISGKGWSKGTQNKFRFLPENRTDFIFAVLAEEWGFVGALAVIMVYIILFTRIYFLSFRMIHLHAQLCILGLLFPLALGMFVNIAMVLGLLPVAGIPLPLVSYGISNLWVCFACLGAIQSIIAQDSI